MEGIKQRVVDPPVDVARYSHAMCWWIYPSLRTQTTTHVAVELSLLRLALCGTATHRAMRLRRDQSQHALDDVIDAKTGGVDANGLFGWTQWRHRATGIAGVTGEDLPQQTV